MSAERLPDVGRCLAAARLQRSLSQAAVARRAGIAASYLSRIENSKVHPTFRTVQRIASALEIPLGEIAGRPPRSRGTDTFCPITTSGSCILELIRHEWDTRARTEAFTAGQVLLLRRFAAWLRVAPRDRQRALAVLIEELSRRPSGSRPL
jgi:transcriptional regulator with XRE-family HTH domain